MYVPNGSGVGVSRRLRPGERDRLLQAFVTKNGWRGLPWVKLWMHGVVLIEGTIELNESFERGSEPFHTFMRAHVRMTRIPEMDGTSWAASATFPRIDA